MVNVKMEHRVGRLNVRFIRFFQGVILYLLLAATSLAQPVTKIAAGNFHSLFIKSDGSLWAMGGNPAGQLGDGTWGSNNLTNRPEQIVSSNVMAIAAGAYHSLFLKADGSLWAMGWNQSGQLGDGTTNYFFPATGTNVPEQIVASRVKAIAAGWYHSLFVKMDGSVWGMGNNQYGQLGYRISGDHPAYGTNRPGKIPVGKVKAIAAGQYHSLFLKKDGSLWGLGLNLDGQLGPRVGNNGYNKYPVKIVGSKVTAIVAGGNQSFFLKKDGSLWAMGNNGAGQLGDGTINPNAGQIKLIVSSNVTAIASGFLHTLFLKQDGSLWSMGSNERGQLGDGTLNQDSSIPEKIVDGGVVAIAAGFDHSLFLMSDGSLWGMGDNEAGQLGDGTSNLSTNLPEQIIGP